MLSPAAFKAYDVRGIVPDELDADGAYALARGYVSAFEPRVMAIGRDMRLSSPDLAAAAVRGAADAGANVVDLGQIGTEMLYFAVGEYGYEGGLQVTASHNPAAYNGMKIVRRGALPVGSDLGIAWDGDADRCFFIDDTGEFVPGDLATALIAQTMLERHPGATIVYDLRASWAVRDVVREAGGTALENRVGHAFIKARIRKEDAVFAGEVSGHYYFKDFYYCDTGVVPALVMLEIVSRSGKPLSELPRPFRERYFISGEINSTVSDVPVKLQQLKELYGPKAERVSHMDGISFEFPDWHFNVRPSNTEPLLRLNLEALDAATMEQRRDEVLELIRG